MIQTNNSATDQQSESRRVTKFRSRGGAAAPGRKAPIVRWHPAQEVFGLRALLFCQLPCRTAFEKVRHFASLTTWLNKGKGIRDPLANARGCQRASGESTGDIRLCYGQKRAWQWAALWAPKCQVARLCSGLWSQGPHNLDPKSGLGEL